MERTLKKVLITDPIDASCIRILENNDINVDYKPKLPVPEILEQIKDADGLIVRSGTTVTAEIIENAKKLKIIGRAGVGVDNIDCTAATYNGTIVINAPGGNTLSAAEHTCAMIMSMTRYIPQGCASLKAEKWDRASFMGSELYGKTLAIVGLGRIGREVAHRMQSFGMTTIGFDPLVSAEESKTFNVEWLNLVDIWPRADFVTLHVPLIPQTKNMIDKNVLEKCKKGVRFVNVARGGIIDENAMYEALDSGQCAGLAVDVYIEEPPTDFKLIKHPKVVCTPHLGASTKEAQVKVAQEIAEQFVDFVSGKSLHGAVNAGALNELMKKERKPWSALAQSLGHLAISIATSGSSDHFSVTVHRYGKELEKDNNLLLTMVLFGVLERKVTSNLNIVNSAALAAAVGIQSQSKYHAEELDFGGPAVGVEIVTNGERHLVIGSVAGHLPLLHFIDSARFHGGAPLRGNTLLFRGAAHPKNLASILDTVSSLCNTVSFVNESESANAEKWYLVGLPKKLDCADKLPSIPVNFVSQLSF